MGLAHEQAVPLLEFYMKEVKPIDAKTMALPCLYQDSSEQQRYVNSPDVCELMGG